MKHDFFMNKSSGILQTYDLAIPVAVLGHLIWRHYCFNPPFDQSQWEGVWGTLNLRFYIALNILFLEVNAYANGRNNICSFVSEQIFYLLPYFKDIFALAFFWLVGHCKKWKIQKNLNMTQNENEANYLLFWNLFTFLNKCWLFCFKLGLLWYCFARAESSLLKTQYFIGSSLFVAPHFFSAVTSMTHPLPGGGGGGGGGTNNIKKTSHWKKL